MRVFDYIVVEYITTGHKRKNKAALTNTVNQNAY